MVFTIPEDLAPEVYPLAWLLGHWQGDGVVVYPTVPEARMRHDVLVTHDGGPYLTWTSTVRLAADDGEDAPGQVWSTEAGYWRLPPDRPEGMPADQRVVELLVADPAGYLSLYAGTLGNGRIDLASDLVARTPDAAEVTAATRMYGLVDGDLLWAWDIAAFGFPLQSYASARLRRLA